VLLLPTTLAVRWAVTLILKWGVSSDRRDTSQCPIPLDYWSKHILRVRIDILLCQVCELAIFSVVINDQSASGGAHRNDP
jgi:hypothetical protein